MRSTTKTLKIYVADTLPGPTLPEKVAYAIAIGFVPLEGEPTSEAYEFARRFKVERVAATVGALGIEYAVTIRGDVIDIDAYRTRLKELE